MHGVALLLIAAAVAHLIARRFSLPPIPVLLLLGVVLARIAPPPVLLLEDALVLGASFLLFQSGLELDPRRMRAQTRAALQVGLIHFGILAGATFMASTLLGFGPRAAAYLAVAMAGSSTLVGVRLLQTRGRMHESFGRLVLGVLLLQDLLVLLAIPLVSAVGGGWAAALPGLLGVGAIALLAAAVRAWGAPLLLRFSDESELILLGMLALLFGFLAFGGWLGLPTVVGSFLAGVALARFPVNGVARPELAPVGDFFTALFFTALGALVEVPTGAQLMQAAVLGSLVIVVTVPLVTGLAERRGFPAKSAIDAGLLLSQTSEMSLVIGLAGVLEGHIDRSVFTVIALATLGTMLATPFLATDRVAWWLIRFHPTRRARAAGTPPSGHVLLLGAGATGMPVLEDLVIAGTDTVVVDDDPAVLAVVGDAGIQTVRGDAAEAGVLVRTGVSQARVVISTIRRPLDNEQVLRLAAGVPVLVRVFDAADAEWIRERGGTPMLYSVACADALMEWFDEASDDLTARLDARMEASPEPEPVV